MSDTHNLHRYSYESFLEAADAAPDRFYAMDWTGNLNTAETKRRARFGDDSNVPKANELLDRLQGAVETPRAVWRPDVGGAYAVVPEYLMGIPDSMRSRRRTRDAASPITVYASIMASAGVDAGQMMARGIAVLALVLKLQAVRPITLYAVCPWSHSTLVIEIPTRPLSIAHAAFALSHPAFFRRLGHMVLYATGDSNTAMETDAYVPTRLEMRPTDLYIGSGVAVDSQGFAATQYQNMLADPVRWINELVQKYAGGAR